jgi:hypothetical protein
MQGELDEKNEKRTREVFIYPLKLSSDWTKSVERSSGKLQSQHRSQPKFRVSLMRVQRTAFISERTDISLIHQAATCFEET